MKQHTVRRFDAQLDEIHETIVTMGRLAERQLEDAARALSELDRARCDEVLAADKAQDRHLLRVESQVLDLLALRQPMGSDLRSILAAMRGSRDLERIGDHAKNIARHTLTLCRMQTRHGVEPLVTLAGSVKATLAKVVDAYREGDVEAASHVRASDVDIDAEYTRVIQQLLEGMESGALSAAEGVHLSFIARSLERLGDHVTNLAEDVIFIVSGQLPQDARAHADRAYAAG